MIDPTAKIAGSAFVEVEDLSIGPGVSIEEGVRIVGNRVRLEAGSSVGARTTIEADVFELGYRSAIGSDSTVGAVGGKRAGKILLGDNVFVGPFNTMLVPYLVFGDYVSLHHHSLTSGYDRCLVGHNTWIGQNCILNCTGRLTIGNNCGIGAYTSIYTHAYNGELLEGCVLWTVDPVTIEDNVWVIGCYNVISPGVTVGRRATILTGSVVSKDVPPAHTVAGVPARDLTDRLTVFRDVTLDEKVELMQRFVREFAEEVHPGRHARSESGYRIEPERGEPFTIVVRDELAEDSLPEGPVLVYVRTATRPAEREDVTVFEIDSKRYRKRLTDPEIQVVKFMNGFRARFVPEDRPVVSDRA